MKFKNIFVKPRDLGKRNWGKEILLALVEGKYTFKKLEMNAGSKGNLQYHHKKDECGYLLSGKLLLRYDDCKSGKLKEKILEQGDCFHFPPGFVHQEEAITDCIILEVSTPHFNDRVRVEKDYGLAEEDGLPSTSIRDVIEK